MTTVQVTLPDELAQKVASAGLLSAEAMAGAARQPLLLVLDTKVVVARLLWNGPPRHAA